MPKTIQVRNGRFDRTLTFLMTAITAIMCHRDDSMLASPGTFENMPGLF